MTKKHKYVECYMDKDGNLRVSKFITKKEYDASKTDGPYVFRVNAEDWKGYYATAVIEKH